MMVKGGISTLEDIVNLILYISMESLVYVWITNLLNNACCSLSTLEIERSELNVLYTFPGISSCMEYIYTIHVQMW